jgi:hypothetical protein
MRHLVKRRRGWLKRFALIALAVLAILAVWALAQRAYLVHVGDQQLAVVESELDESEPGWRWEDIQAQRDVIPEGENSALIVLAAMKLLPRNWPDKPAVAHPELKAPMEPRRSLPDRLEEIEPVCALDAELTADLFAELREVAPALAEARKIINRPKGRYHIAYTKDFLTTRLDQIQEARRCAYLLGFDATTRAAAKDYDGGLASARGVLNAGRSVGDEPIIIPQLVRMACEAQAIRNMERVLAQGQASNEALASTSSLLADEASQNLWLIAARGERAAAPAVLRCFYTGELDLEQFTIGRDTPSRRRNLTGWLYVRPVMHTGDAAALRYLTRLVHAAQLPPDERRKQVKVVEEEIREIKASKNYELVSVVLLVPQAGRFTETQDCNQARLRCAHVGMALERYRLANGRWPEVLNQLVPAFLAGIPDDPFDTGPLHYRRLEDGVVVYSVGPDGEDNGGVLARQNPKVPKTDLGFRLWDPARRGQPPAPKTPPDGRPEGDR